MSEDTQNKDKQNEQDANHQANNDDSGGKQESNNGKMVSMSQSDLDALITDRLRRGMASAVKDYNEALGVENKEQALQMLESQRKAQEAEMSDLEKMQLQNTKLQESLNSQTASYNHVLFQNAVILESANEDYGLPVGRTQSLLQLMNLDNLKVDDGKVSGVAEEIKRTLEQHPFLTFANPESDKGKDKLGDKGTQTKRDKRLKDVLDRVNENDKTQRRKRGKPSL
jgi:hypothetical protein